VGRRRHGEGGRRAAALGRGGDAYQRPEPGRREERRGGAAECCHGAAVEMPAGGRSPDGVKNAKVAWQSVVVALWWRAFWRGLVGERLLERTSGQENTMLGR